MPNTENSVAIHTFITSILYKWKQNINNIILFNRKNGKQMLHGVSMYVIFWCDDFYNQNIF